MITCKYCHGFCKKDGKQKSGMQKYRCKTCLKYQQKNYKQYARDKETINSIERLVRRNMGFRDIASYLKIAYNTLIKYIHLKSKNKKEPCMREGGVYEIDEIVAYSKKGKPQICGVYAIETKTNKIIGINVGSRKRNVLMKTINAVLMTKPRRIYTDGYVVYKNEIPNNLHRISKAMLAKIERLHLTARNKLKMLNRKTLAYVRKPETLLMCLKLLFWK